MHHRSVLVLLSAVDLLNACGSAPPRAQTEPTHPYDVNRRLGVCEAGLPDNPNPGGKGHVLRVERNPAPGSIYVRGVFGAKITAALEYKGRGMITVIVDVAPNDEIAWPKDFEEVIGGSVNYCEAYEPLQQVASP
jgi:hypothetical protein